MSKTVAGCVSKKLVGAAEIYGKSANFAVEGHKPPQRYTFLPKLPPPEGSSAKKCKIFCQAMQRFAPFLRL
jgi:hypothetical protein